MEMGENSVGAAIWNEHRPKWRLVRGTYTLAEEGDRKVQEGLTCGTLSVCC